MCETEPKRYFLNFRALPADFPTHSHKAEFWEELGRAVASFGFLEETLAKAIFAFSAQRKVPNDQLDVELNKWISELEHALSDTLNPLIDNFGKYIRIQQAGDGDDVEIEKFLNRLLEVAKIRNVLCHASWRTPDDTGGSLPFYVDKKNMICDARIDIAYLRAVRDCVVELTCDVINSVTQRGWQFPGFNGPGIPIVNRSRDIRRADYRSYNRYSQIFGAPSCFPSPSTASKTATR